MYQVLGAESSKPRCGCHRVDRFSGASKTASKTQPRPPFPRCNNVRFGISADFERADVGAAAIEFPPGFTQAGPLEAGLDGSGGPNVHVTGQGGIESLLVAASLVVVGIEATGLDARRAGRHFRTSASLAIANRDFHRGGLHGQHVL